MQGGASMVLLLHLFVPATASDPAAQADLEGLRGAFSLLQSRVEALEQDKAATSARLAHLEAENAELRGRQHVTVAATVSAEGDMRAGQQGGQTPGAGGEGRRLQASPSPPPGQRTCCRWTPADVCGTNIPAERFESCTALHEYLETKTTTHEFENLEGCLGGDESSWSATFDGAHSNITMSGDAGETSVLTPLKVTHSANCQTTQPTLTVQMNTELAHTLTLDGLDVAARLRELGPYQDPNAWTINNAYFLASQDNMPHIGRDTSAAGYVMTAGTKRPIRYMLTLRPAQVAGDHTFYCLSATQGQCSLQCSDCVYVWIAHSGLTRTSCPQGVGWENTGYSSGQIYHYNTEAHADAGTDAPADDNLFTNYATGDFFTMELSADRTQITFHSNRAGTGTGAAFRTCTVPPDVTFYGQVRQYNPYQLNALPWIKYA